MVITKTPTRAGFEAVFQSNRFKCAFITASEQYAFGKIKELKRHNDSDEVFVLLQGKAVLLTRNQDSSQYETTLLCPNTAYNVTSGTWHYLAVSDDAVVFVAESGTMEKENTQVVNIQSENIVLQER